MQNEEESQDDLGLQAQVKQLRFLKTDLRPERTRLQES